MSSKLSSKNHHQVKSAAAVLAEDVICQSFTQSSSTLAYACLLIRQKKYDLATHVLHSLEAKQASRIKDMVFYMQVQIAIETGEHAVAKKRLVPRVNQYPNDLVALSLLESSIFLEWTAWQEKKATGSNAVSSTPSHELESAPLAFGSEEGGITKSFIAVASEVDSPLTPMQSPVSKPEGNSTISHSEISERDFVAYQGLASEANTYALALGNRDQNKFKSACNNPELGPLITLLPQLLPETLATACRVLDGGDIHKICFSFQNLTVTSLNLGAEYLELITGNINQSLLTMVRAENIFQKQASFAQALFHQASQALEAHPHD